MGGASLVLYEAGVVSLAQLTLNRNVTLSDYFFIPAICGLVLAIALLLVIGYLVGIDENDGLRITLNDRRFWIKTIPKSKVPQVNLVPVATIVATILGTSTLAGSLFPGVSIGIFLALTSGVAVVAAGGGSLVFDLLDWRWVRNHAPNEIGVPLALTAGGDKPSFSFPAGASIESAGGLIMTRDQVSTEDQAQVLIPNIVTIPENSTVEVVEGTSLAFLEGPKVLLAGASTLQVSGDNAIVIGVDPYSLPRYFKAKTDATIEYEEGTTAPNFSPSGAKAGRRRYGRRSFNLTLERHNERQTNLLIALVPVFAVVFAAGAELGVIGVLSIDFSDATGFGHFLVYDLIVLVALFVIWSIVWKIQRATYAQPDQLELNGPAPAP